MSRRAAPDWLTHWEYAHRGLHSGGVPENSPAAARAAIAAGMGIECDIQRSKDDQAMVFHDWELDRLTGLAKKTSDLIADDIEKLSLSGTGESPQRLGKLLQIVSGQVPVLIEIKSKPGYRVEPTCQTVGEVISGYDGEIAVMSFDPFVAQWFKQEAPQLACGLVMREDSVGHTRTHSEREAALKRADPDFLAYHVDALPNPWVANLRANGVPILTWTVNSRQARTVGIREADALICEGEGVA